MSLASKRLHFAVHIDPIILGQYPFSLLSWCSKAAIDSLKSTNLNRDDKIEEKVPFEVFNVFRTISSLEQIDTPASQVLEKQSLRANATQGALAGISIHFDLQSFQTEASCLEHSSLWRRSNGDRYALELPCRFNHRISMDFNGFQWIAEVSWPSWILARVSGRNFKQRFWWVLNPKYR